MASPKYAAVQSGIINLIATDNIRPGEAIPTERELAKRFGVSLITIRRAVGNLEQNEILRREQGRGTFVIADIEGRVDSGTIAMLTVTREDMTFPSIGTPQVRLHAGLEKRGYRLTMVMAGQAPDAEAVKPLEGVSGVIASGWLNPKWVQLLQAIDVPVVFLGSVPCDRLGIPMVTFDWRRMAVVLTEELYRRGAKKIGLMLGGSDYTPSTAMRDGFRSVLRKRGQKLEDRVVFYSDGDVPLDAQKYLEDNPDLDAILMESGCCPHVLSNLLHQKRRPLLGLMSTRARYGKVCKSIIEAEFVEDIQEKALETLLKVTESSNAKIKDVKIKPCLG